MDSEVGPTQHDLESEIDHAVKEEQSTSVPRVTDAENEPSTSHSPEHSPEPTEKDRAALKELLDELKSQGLPVADTTSSEQSANPTHQETLDSAIQYPPHEEDSTFQEEHKAGRGKRLLKGLGIVSTVLGLFFRR